MFNSIAKGITSIFVAISVFFGLKEQPEPSPQVEVVEVVSPSPESSPIEVSTPSAIPEVTQPSPSPIPSIKPSPSPETVADLNIELSGFLPNPNKIENRMMLMDILDGKKGVFKKDDEIKELFIQVRNNGEVDAEKINVNLIVDGESIGQFKIDLVKKKDSIFQRFSINNAPRDIGNHRVEVQVNPAKDFPETRFDNNSKIFEYEVIN